MVLMCWQVYNPQGEHVASLVYAEDADALVAFYGDGATIRTTSDTILWHEGLEDQPAGESYDHVATTVGDRMTLRRTRKLKFDIDPEPERRTP